MAKRKIVFLAGLAAVITLLTWALLPYLFPLQLHTVDINLEYRNCLDFTVRTDVTNVRNLIPSSITVWPRGPTSWGVNFQIGLLHMEVEGKSYDAISLILYSGINSQSIPPVFVARGHYYILGIFTNNSELGEVLRSYGLPHTCVQASYQAVDEGNLNQTILTMTYPDGSLLIDVSFTTWPSEVVQSEPSTSYVNYYHLRGDNVTVFHWKAGERSYVHRPLQEGGVGRLNMTTSEGSVIWEALGTEYVINMQLSTAYLLYVMNGKIGCMELIQL